MQCSELEATQLLLLAVVDDAVELVHIALAHLKGPLSVVEVAVIRILLLLLKLLLKKLHLVIFLCVLTLL